MCQSLSITAEVSELSDRFQLDQVLFYTSNRHEINPTESVSAIIEHKGSRVLDDFRWGLMPYWAKDSLRMDSRTMLWKPIFDRILKKQRCVIPCSAFYVSRTEGKKTVRAKLAMKSGTFGIAGLYDVFRSASGEEMRTCTILMTQSNSLVSPYSALMPAILETEDVDRWLRRDAGEPGRLHDMLRTMDAMRMVSIPLDAYGEADSGFEAPRPKLV
ncbi:SOS response-associated peptidase [Paenibacillus humicola]|uniref:SOS response-associated peptidase n=1 Tax=Paenibacillus humicola TaxID=3110540 RepID=UPI00237AC15E|nr:SOS response-associated peptidase family protein [Paenibacillus humicola]